MRWRDQRESGNVEDRRGQGGGFGFPFPGGGMRFPSGGSRRGGGGIGLIGLLIILGLILFFGVDPKVILGPPGGGGPAGFPDIQLPQPRSEPTNFPARLVELPAGHLSNIECPAAYADIVSSFLLE